MDQAAGVTVEGRDDKPSPIPRATVEFLTLLAIGILVSRTFAAEAYIVPTGSMAPTLLGMHQAYRCPGCGIRFPIGVDEGGRSGRAVCPNCGGDGWEGAEVVEGGGDRVLVHKFVYDLRPPRRWEVAVFQNPAEPDQAYVKRVVGLPGESVLIRDGDVWIDGALARKTLAEQRAMRILVYDHNFQPADPTRNPRWALRSGDGRSSTPCGWKPAAGGFGHRAMEAAGTVDWLEYKHRRPERDVYGPVHDFNPYNGADLPAENAVDDLMIEADLLAIGGDSNAGWVVRLGNSGEEWLVELPRREGDGIRPVEVRLNGERIEPRDANERLKIDGRPHHLEASWIDRRLTVALDGIPLFAPIDVTGSRETSRGWLPPAVGIRSNSVGAVENLKIYRDVYYTEALAYVPRRPFGVEEPYALKAGEYFVLGDNSPVSNDSRFWAKSPVVEADRFLGKPFLVHLPSRAVPLRVFGRELYWIPDPREIRYIR